jgi:hypothetical protein
MLRSELFLMDKITNAPTIDKNKLTSTEKKEERSIILILKNLWVCIKTKQFSS